MLRNSSNKISFFVDGKVATPQQVPAPVRGPAQPIQMGVPQRVPAPAQVKPQRPKTEMLLVDNTLDDLLAQFTDSSLDFGAPPPQPVPVPSPYGQPHEIHVPELQPFPQILSASTSQPVGELSIPSPQLPLLAPNFRFRRTFAWQLTPSVAPQQHETLSSYETDA